MHHVRSTSKARDARRLIVNADDFGISRGVNRGIVEAHRYGLVTSASLMTNLPSAEDAITRAAGCPDLAVGLHLTLTAGRPLSPAATVPSLVDHEGHFFVLGELLARLSLGRVRGSDLERELTAQIAWATDRGFHPTHFDSHHHVHVHPRVAATVVGLAASIAIAYVRCPVELPGPASAMAAAPKDLARALAISAAAALFRRRLRARGLATSDHFEGVAIGLGFDTSALLRRLRRLRPGLTELMTHPGYPDAALARVTVFSEGRDRELGALTALQVRALVRSGGIQLVNFGTAAAGRSYT